MKLRRSKRPDKQLLWFMIKRDSRLSKSKEVGLDVGCSFMINKRYFLTSKYIGVDVNREELSAASVEYPDAEIIHGSLFDLQSLHADFVLCVEVFLNTNFDKKRAVDATEKLVSFVNRGGVLLMNTGNQTSLYDEEIKALLEANFKRVTCVRYGNFGIDKCSKFFSLLIGAGMYFSPSIRRLSKGKRITAYYRCVSKI